MASTAWRTRSRVFSETMEGLPSAREAVISETPAASATSCSVAGLGGVGVFMGKRDRGLETAIDALEHRFGAGVVQRGGELVGDRGVGVPTNLDFLDTDD